MSVHLVIFWNGHEALDAMCTSAMAYDTLMGHLKANYVKLPSFSSSQIPSVDGLMASAIGSTWVGQHDDGTGRTTWAMKKTA